MTVAAKTKQAGAALITALIFLVVLTLVAVTTVQNVTLQEQMTSAVRQGNIALEIAENGLRDGEAFIMGLPNPGAFFASGNGVYDVNQAPAPWNVNWESNSVREGDAVELDGIEYDTRYFVEFIGPMAEQLETGEIVTGGALNTIGQNLGYRIVSRGLGNDGVSERVVETYVARTFQ
ncbi:pilus assembly PilX family protein [Saccharospirillum impatiens]|uniref:pilus assembly PilX family protein n=1 Tax=Saccharospirillum impatiens TaxID=169438 RepID=UPI00048DD0FC|nr:PilX N-terminal domain-containing pilus assembly protein [Saccharospirillum impatiens]